jgi:hypothetical protein
VLILPHHTNGFITHGIKRISVSNVNKFREAPDAWACQYLGGHRFPTGWAAVQGQAVESGVELGLFGGGGIDDCVKESIDQLKSASMVLNNRPEELEKRIPIVTRMTETALENLMPLGAPEKPAEGRRQHSVGIDVRFREGPGGTVPLLGYLDFYYPQHNLVVDLKTTSKSPSKWSLGHGIQAAVYQKAIESMTGKKPAVKFAYALTRKKDPYVELTLTDEDAADFLKQFKQTVIQMEALLSMTDDSQKIISVLPHNPDTFYWNNAEEIRASFYGS